MKYGWDKIEDSVIDDEEYYIGIYDAVQDLLIREHLTAFYVPLVKLTYEFKRVSDYRFISNSETVDSWRKKMYGDDTLDEDVVIVTCLGKSRVQL